MAIRDIETWLKKGSYLPPDLRDWHVQKELFKAIHERIENDPDAIIKRPSWVEAHCYVIEVFLWFMARRGYTLQRTRQKGDFRDLHDDIEASTTARNNAAMNALTAYVATQKDSNHARPQS